MRSYWVYIMTNRSEATKQSLTVRGPRTAARAIGGRAMAWKHLSANVSQSATCSDAPDPIVKPAGVCIIISYDATD